MKITKEHFSLDNERSTFLINKLKEGFEKDSNIFNLSKKLEEIEKNTILLPGFWESKTEIERLIKRGVIFGPTEKFDLGGPSQCHNNVIDKYLENNNYEIVTGYALSEDGLWRSHSWLLKEGIVFETTEERLKYFGVILKEDEPGLFESELNEIEDFIKN